jgi:hypothetical protein
MNQTSSFRRPLCGLLIAGLTAIGSGCAKQPVGPVDDTAVAADLALKGGAIYAVDGSRSWARAVAIRGGHMLWITGGGWLMSAFGLGAL